MKTDLAARPLTPREWREHPLPPIDSTHSKDDRGSVLIIAGSERNPGAAWLAAVGALRAGAGRLTIATMPRAIPLIAPTLPEAMVMPLRRSDALSERIERADSVVIGPGWNADNAARRWTRWVLQRTTKTVVVDAGALHGCDDAPMPRHCILTPHPGEMAKLSRHTREYVEKNPERVARDFARKAGVVLLLKGPTSYLVEADGPLWAYDGGHPGLGTSGSGDVLAGCIGGLAARGLLPFWSAAWGARLHGEAGRLLARTIGPSGYIAREIADALPNVMRRHQ
jgi:ADP-dependent NAD(P)H-hydrate dehydratase